MNDQDVENKVAELGLSAPRVTNEEVYANIVGETYTTLPNGRTTICQLTLRNGFTVEGKSACVSLANYNKELGDALAKADAVKQIWPLMGYHLACQLEGK